MGQQIHTADYYAGQMSWFTRLFGIGEYRIRYELKEIDDNLLVRKIKRIPLSHKYILTLEVIHKDNLVIEANGYDNAHSISTPLEYNDYTEFNITFKDKPDLKAELKKFKENMVVKEKFSIKGEI